MAEKEFELGTDPEGLLVVKKTNRIRSPQDIIHDPDPHDKYGKATAIGKDGDRDTSSFEFRPGRSQSGMELVNRLGMLVARLRKHYHPPGIVYKAGAFWYPEPIGGHIHLSWPQDRGGMVVFSQGYSDKIWRVSEILSGFRAQAEFLVPYLFDEQQVEQRKEYARAHARDFASSASVRPNSLEQIMHQAHVEYRYPPSWLDTPEAAYCFLGGAELIVREVLASQVGSQRDWSQYVARMFTDPGVAPPNSPSLADAFDVARDHKNQIDFSDTWVD